MTQLLNLAFSAAALINSEASVWIFTSTTVLEVLLYLTIVVSRQLCHICSLHREWWNKMKRHIQKFVFLWNKIGALV